MNTKTPEDAGKVCVYLTENEADAVGSLLLQAMRALRLSFRDGDTTEGRNRLNLLRDTYDALGRAEISE